MCLTPAVEISNNSQLSQGNVNHPYTPRILLQSEHFQFQVSFERCLLSSVCVFKCDFLQYIGSQCEISERGQALVSGNVCRV